MLTQLSACPHGLEMRGNSSYTYPMSQPRSRTVQDRFLTRLIYSGGLAVTIFLLLLGWIAFRMQSAAESSIEKTVRIEGALSHVVYLDMVLSGFARTAVTTGELKWLKRYEIVEPKLAETLDSIFPLLPDKEKESLFSQTKIAAKNLRDKEKLAFSFLGQGLKKQAHDLLFSETYDQDRDANYKVLGELGESMKKYESRLLELSRKELRRSVAVLAIAFPVLFMSGFTLYLLLNRWQTELLDLNSKLSKMLAQSETLVGFSRKFNVLNLSELSRNANETFPSLFHAELFSIFLLDPKTRALKLTLHNHKDWKERDPFVVQENDGIMWDVVRSQEEILIEKFSASRYAKAGEYKRYDDDRAICIPLLAGKTVIGVLNLNNIADDGTTAEHLATIRRVADHLSLTINNAILYERNEDLAETDQLTQLFNRRFLDQELARAMESSKRYDEKFSILMTDLDHFKNVNDTYGHTIGDHVLKTTAELLKFNLRLTDRACRYGGEEFVIVLHRTPGLDAVKFAERIRQSLETQPIRYEDGKELHATLSIGICEYRKGESAESLLSRADSALYAAKQGGRNRCVLKES